MLSGSITNIHNLALEENSESPQDKEVENFYDTEHADPHAEPEKASDVGQQLQAGEPLLPLLLHEVQLLEVDVDVGHVIHNVCVV